MNVPKPRVSIGLPVFNGERYLPEALDAILGQTFGDLELIISDNGSTDQTQALCEARAASDPRVRYLRNECNVGAARNFNRVFELSSGQYFKWAAHDDKFTPDFIAKCVAALERDIYIVLCPAGTRIIDENGNVVRDYEVHLKTDSPKPQARLRELLRFGQKCYQVFGVIRATAIRSARLLGNYSGGDNVLLARLALLGRFHEIPEYAFLSRDHPERFSRLNPDSVSRTAWFDPGKWNQTVFPHWKFWGEYWRSIHHAPLNPYERAFCYVELVRLTGRWRRRLWGDLTRPARRFLGRSQLVRRARDLVNQ